MGLVTGQSVISTVATVIFTAPPGPSVITVTSSTASTAEAYLGGGTAVTSSNGIPLIPKGTISWAGYPGSSAQQVSAITTGSSAATIGWVISSER